MARITLRQLLDHAAEHSYGVPAFNINNAVSHRSNSFACVAHRLNIPAGAHPVSPSLLDYRVREIANSKCDTGVFQWAVMAATSQKQVLYDSITSVWLAQWFVMENPALRVILVHCLPAKRGWISGLVKNANLEVRINLHH